MDEKALRNLLEQVRAGSAPVDDALEALRSLPFVELGYATVDHHRALRQGVPEVVFGQGKTVEHIVGIARELVHKKSNVMVTRVDAARAAEVAEQLPASSYNAMARILTIESVPIAKLEAAPVGVVSAGTSDLPVAEECAETLRMLGIDHERIYDIGVAGIHRLLHKVDRLRTFSTLVVVAGMEGALPSVVGGLVDIPVIAVPTSIGYGAAFGGLAALLGMLNSCASGITVCNIDNGFGAAFAVQRMLRVARKG
jgi:NCAIR mutase (PurE)-related protein